MRYSGEKSESHKNILSHLHVTGREEEKGANVFNVMDCVVGWNLPQALKILNELLMRKNHLI